MDYKKSSDLARVSCAGCKGCGDCCRNMGDTIRLDPYDFWQLERKLERTALDMYHDVFDFSEIDGIYLPHLLMKPDQAPVGPVSSGNAEQTEESGSHCIFLDEEGQCSIHDSRPGLCRLFPLGRNYEPVGFSYFLVPDACDMPGKSKVRIEDYLGIQDLRKYEAFVSDWHRFLGEMKRKTRGLEEEKRKELAEFIVQEFFIGDYYTEEDFYLQYMKRRTGFYRFS